MPVFDPKLDLTIERFMRAVPEKVWQAWTTPELLEQWWVPHPSRCRVVALDVRAGGAFRTEYSEGGATFVPHLDACFLLVEPGRRLIFTDALTAGFRPAASAFITADFTFAAAPGGTAYRAHVMHRSEADRDRHVELGFFDGWTTVTEQLAALVEAETN